MLLYVIINVIPMGINSRFDHIKIHHHHDLREAQIEKSSVPTPPTTTSSLSASIMVEMHQPNLMSRDHRRLAMHPQIFLLALFFLTRQPQNFRGHYRHYHLSCSPTTLLDSSTGVMPGRSSKTSLATNDIHTQNSP